MSTWHPGQLLFAGFEGTALPEDLAADIAAGRIGGAILFARNVQDPEQVRRLVQELHRAAPADRALTVAIDQEGGRVQRLRAPWTEWPPMRRLGERGSLEDSRAVGRGLGRELADLGIDLDFTPCVDVDTNPDNPVIGDRSFARSPETVAEHAVALLEGLQGEGVAGCAKHFPGHGDTHLDSHVALPRVDHDLARLRRVELPPFQALARAGVASIVTAHVIISCLDAERPATLAPEALRLLREEVGYDGLVFGDDFEMAAMAEHYGPAEATRLAIGAGCDALLVCSRSDVRAEVLGALAALPDASLENAARRMT
ncbi:MAG: beta-N-acetylhexosaminidase, partial [Myxococcota bacterium]